MSTNNTTQVAAFAAASSAALVVLVNHASDNGSFDNPATFIGIAVGVALAVTAWFAGKRINKNRAN